MTDIHVGPVVRDSAGRRWAVRSWQAPLPGTLPAQRETCVQVGELQAGSLVRLLGRRVRVLRYGERTVCGATALSQGRIDPGSAPLVVERLVDDPSAAHPRLVLTIVAGVLPAHVRSVSLSAGPVAVDPVSRSFLSVLTGRVPRSALRLTFALPGRRQVLDFGSGHGDPYAAPVVPGSERVALRLNDTRLRSALALVVYRVRYQTVRGPITEPCGEPGEVVDGEIGTYNPPGVTSSTPRPWSSWPSSRKAGPRPGSRPRTSTRA